MMKKIKDIISKPSEALQAMVDGLKKQSKRSNFRIDMTTFGQTDGSICYGCAATCAVQQLSGVTIEPNDDFTLLTPRSITLGLDLDQMSDFEDAIDEARKGYIGELFDFFEVDKEDMDVYADFELDTQNWKSELPKVTAYIEYLKSNNL